MTSWTTPKTFTAAAALTAAELNTYLSDNTLYLKEQAATRSLVLASDVTTASASYADITGLTFSVANGTNYNVTGCFTYEHSNTGGGPIIGFNHPGGSARMLVEYYGKTAANTLDREHQTTVDGGTGTSATAVTGTAYFILFNIRYQCTASGTFAMRKARNSPGTLTIHQGSGITIISG